MQLLRRVEQRREGTLFADPGDLRLVAHDTGEPQLGAGQHAVQHRFEIGQGADRRTLHADVLAGRAPRHVLIDAHAQRRHAAGAGAFAPERRQPVDVQRRIDHQSEPRAGAGHLPRQLEIGVLHRRVGNQQIVESMLRQQLCFADREAHQTAEVVAADRDDAAQQVGNPHRLGGDAQVLAVRPRHLAEPPRVRIERVEVDEHQRQALAAHQGGEPRIVVQRHSSNPVQASPSPRRGGLSRRAVCAYLSSLRPARTNSAKARMPSLNRGTVKLVKRRYFSAV